MLLDMKQVANKTKALTVCLLSASNHYKPDRKSLIIASNTWINIPSSCYLKISDFWFTIIGELFEDNTRLTNYDDFDSERYDKYMVKAYLNAVPFTPSALSVFSVGNYRIVRTEELRIPADNFKTVWGYRLDLERISFI